MAEGAKLVLAWTGRDSNHHLNVLSSTGDSHQLGNKVTLGDAAVAGLGAAAFGGHLLVAWGGTDAAHRLNVMRLPV